MDIKTIDFPYNGISCISDRQFQVHKKLYSGYVDKVNETSKLIKEEAHKSGNSTYSKYRGLKKGQGYAIDGVILHEFYFANLGGGKDCAASLKQSLTECFGGYSHWADDFKACALSARGWAVLAYEQRTKTMVNILQDTHDDGVLMGAYPILVLDMYEHAYFIDYASNKEEYFNRFMEDINWEAVNARFNRLDL